MGVIEESGAGHAGFVDDEHRPRRQELVVEVAEEPGFEVEEILGRVARPRGGGAHRFAGRLVAHGDTASALFVRPAGPSNFASMSATLSSEISTGTARASTVFRSQVPARGSSRTRSAARATRPLARGHWPRVRGRPLPGTCRSSGAGDRA